MSENKIENECTSVTYIDLGIRVFCLMRPIQKTNRIYNDQANHYTLLISVVN